jgi:uncharacterized DUF497 family protein
MRDDRFEWSDAKARANLIDHKVSFDVAKLAFDDPRRKSTTASTMARIASTLSAWPRESS